GFLDLSKEQLSVLNQWAEFVYEPLLQDRVRRIQEHGDPSYGRSVAEKVHAGLRRTGSVRPPREFVLMDRAAVGLGSVFLRLKAELNWSRLFHELIVDFDAEEVGRRQAVALAEAGVPASA
ncbi:MAG: AarF/ABC1/UbiB kinase family protein, partial [Acetobacteraceae bacterium]|nr:AarF/ABC1/UbiB kinase family protein [Acetobacteraceae bacterium]